MLQTQIPWLVCMSNTREERFQHHTINVFQITPKRLYRNTYLMRDETEADVFLFNIVSRW